MIDAYASHLWGTVEDIAAHLEPGWREALEYANPGQVSVRVPTLYTNPRGSGAYRTHNGKMNMGYEFGPLQEDLLDRGGADRVILGYEDGLGAAAYINNYLGLAICRALNDWTLKEWVARDERLYALALVPTGSPEGAAEEIRRVGKDPRIVGILLGANVLGVPYGQSIYDPIYEAAVEQDLPIVLHAKADGASTISVPQMAGGLASTWAEYDMLAYQSPAAHIVSMIGQGTFELYPSLRVFVVGTGATWIPAQMWRADWAYGYSANEAPWLTKLPSEYFGEHVKVSTYGLEKPRQPERLAQALETMPWFDQTLVYASGYPSIYGEEPSPILDRLPKEWHEKVLHENAMDVFRWPDRPRHAAATPTLRRESMPLPKLRAGELAGVVRPAE